MVKELDEILYDALTSDSEIMAACGYPDSPARIFSTCVEVSPLENDNTPLPYIIIMDDGFQNDIETKDDVWEGNSDHVAASIMVCAESRDEAVALCNQCRLAVSQHIRDMLQQQLPVPDLQALTSPGTDWDWQKPCYHKTLQYQCDIDRENV